MCGIYGVINKSETVTNYQCLESFAKKLFQSSLQRGSEATGLVVVDETKIKIIKQSTNVKRFFTSETYKKFIKDIDGQAFLLLGHTRMATHGNSINEKNNQPVISHDKNIIGLHNGLIIDHEDLYNYSQHQSPKLDTQFLLDYLAKNISELSNQKDIVNVIYTSLCKVRGVINLALLLPKNDILFLYSNNGSLFILKTDSLIYFASEKSTLEKLGVDKEKIQQLKNSYQFFPVHCTKKKIYCANGDECSTPSFNKILNNINCLRKHRINQEAISNIKRCSRCILPSTTPFITFDEDGVCNYCADHQRITYKGREQLETILNKYRKSNGEVDCLVAFSGGRDSSYGLHLVKKELGMNPVAFTYDWGMITDLGRRNQARILGKLGVEQILVSADIAKKRQHIKQNILAWLKRPDLGMVPLFMQGDKQCEYYADQVMRRYRIPLMIYFRGNELEKEEFKAGYCGIKEADPGGVIHNLSITNKLKLLSYYGRQYFLNPAYFNSSLVDTAFGYLSTYVIPHNYLYLWHYLPWDEGTIIRTLTSEYDWEFSDDTPTSWRIGDGTPAFYNYIYYQVQGFTENDSLRARQVREGLLDRKNALKLVRAENQPQYHNLKWYFDTLDLDGDKVLDVVDKMKKKY